MKRPDLDAIEDRQRELGDPRGEAYKTVDWTCFHNTNLLLAYARHLEAENKRLRKRALAAEQVIYEELPT